MLADIFGVDGIIVLVVVVVLLFGSTQLPKLARSLGSAQGEFKKGLADGHKESESTAADTADTTTPKPAGDSGSANSGSTNQ
jgi:sec-independent protein translocase protein TatA